jgi:chromosome segregation ATPase
MNEEINDFAEFLIEAKKVFKITDDVFNIINTQSDVKRSIEYLQCAICGIAYTDILSMSKAELSVSSICEQRTQLLTKLYQNADELYDSVEQASQLAKELTKKNQEIRELFERDVKEAMAREREANERTIAQAQEALRAKTSELEMLHKQYMSVMNENDQTQKQIAGYKDRIQKLEMELKNKQTTAMEQAQDTQQPVPETGMFNKLIKKRRRAKQAQKQSYSYKLFTKNIIQNPEYSEAQKQYLIRCMTDGMPYSVLKRFAAPNLSIEMMEQLRKYYEDNVI